MLEVKHAYLPTLLVDDEVVTIGVTMDHANLLKPSECIQAIKQVVHRGELSIQLFQQDPHNPPTFRQMA